MSVGELSLSCLKSENVPPTATLSALAPACEKANVMIASSALMLRPDCLPL